MTIQCNFIGISKPNFSSIVIDLIRLLVFLWASFLASSIIVFIQVSTTRIMDYNDFVLNDPVDKENCTCECFDGFMDGIHKKVSIRFLLF